MDFRLYLAQSIPTSVVDQRLGQPCKQSESHAEARKYCDLIKHVAPNPLGSCPGFRTEASSLECGPYVEQRAAGDLRMCIQEIGESGIGRQKRLVVQKARIGRKYVPQRRRIVIKKPRQLFTRR